MKWLRAYFSVPFKALAIVVRIYQANRGWLEARLARQHAARLVKGFLALTLLVWLAIWLFAGEDSRQALNQALQSLWSEIGK